MRTVSDALCREYGLSLIKPVRRGMPYAAWQAEKEGKPNRRKALREDIDRILANENIESLEAFYDTLRAYGYAVMTDRKYVAICPPGGERNIRLQSLGENYEPEALHLRILRIKADRLLGKTKVISYGQYVHQGDVIGYVGSTGNSSGNHLHFELYLENNRVDPYPYIGTDLLSKYLERTF